MSKKKKKTPFKWSKYTKLKRKESLGNFLSQERREDIPYFFAPKDFFTPVTEESIQEGDWLDEFNDKPQPYRKFTYFNEVTPQQNVLYLLPLDPSDTQQTFFGELVEFFRCFFPLDVKVMDTSRIRRYNTKLKQVKTRKIKKCKENRNGIQYFVPDLNTMMMDLLPEDAYCILAVTGVDIYHRDDWEYVFGKATTRGRVGVISFCRYSKPKRLLLKRVIDVSTHEILHMFGIQHCIYYRCVMNGANDLEEQDRRNQELCPVCVRKMRKVIGKFDLSRWYSSQMKFYRKHESIYQDLLNRMERRMKYIQEILEKKCNVEEYKKIFEDLDC